MSLDTHDTDPPGSAPAAAPGLPLAHGGGNALLDSLPSAERAALPLQWVALRLGDSIYRPDVPMRHACFPASAVVSLHIVTASGATAETCSVGREGMVGIPLFMGGGGTPSSAMVHTGGHGWLLERGALLQAFERRGALHRVLLRYTQAMMTQIAQTAACYRHHSVEQQLSGWLMTAQDRMRPGELVMTQELLSSLLGVRRESITHAVGRLQELGHIRVRRGHITVLDTPGLAERACECYAVVKTELRRLTDDALKAQQRIQAA
jgi:CRP-like cAMP-binding protein